MSVLTLRPGVRATGLRTGLHVRGWTGSVTLSGGPAWWRLWQAVEPVLARGAGPEWLAEQRARPGVGPALDALITALRDNDLVVDLAASTVDGLLGPWLLAAAADPGAALARLGVEPVRLGGSPGPDLERALAEVLADCGRPVVLEIVHSGLLGLAVLSMAGGSVAVRVTGEFAVVTSVDAEDAVIEQVHAVGTVLCGPGDHGRARAGTLTGLAASTAVHRLLSAAAGGPDPAGPTGARRGGPPGTRWVWVARPDPLRAAYHPWWPSAPAGDRSAMATASGASSGPGWLDLLTDPELGPVRTPHPDRLPQLPAALAHCQWPSSHRDSPPWTTIGVAEEAEPAQAEAVRRALELALGLPPHAALARVDAEAVGIAWRRRADAAVRRGAGVPLPPGWSGHDRARRWWRALTDRFGVPATVRVRRLGDAFHAEVRTAGGTAPVRSWAVEAEPGDAFALAVMRATGAVQLGRAGLDRSGPVAAVSGVTGAAVDGRPGAVGGPDAVPDAVRAELGGSVAIIEPGTGPGRGFADAGLAAAVRATGWVVARWEP